MKKKNKKYNILLYLIMAGAFLGYILTLNGVPVKAFKSIKTIVNNVDIEEYKTVLHNSIVAIQMTYDSGLRGAGIKDGWEEFLSGIVGFDSKEPSSVIKSAIPYINKYDENIGLKAKDYEDPSSVPTYFTGEEAEGTPYPRITPNSGIKTTPAPKPTQKIVPYQPPNNNNSSKISFSNVAGLSFNADSLLKAPLGFSIPKSGPKVILYHTHTHEGYLGSGYGGVVKVGNTLKSILESKYGIKVLHNGTVNDNDFNNSYGTAYNTITSILKGNKEVNIIFDLHRDAIGDVKHPLKVTTKYKGETVAQVMFVVGTNKNLYHPGWQKNLGFAIKLQKQLNNICPGIARPINISENRYNEHVRPGALIIEVGGNGNTLEECKASMKYVANAINNIIKDAE